MKKYLRVDCTSYGTGDGRGSGCMTGIQVEIDTECSFEEAKAKALGFIAQEFSRYGLDEALRGLGMSPEHEAPTVAVNGRLYAPAR